LIVHPSQWQLPVQSSRTHLIFSNLICARSQPCQSIRLSSDAPAASHSPWHDRGAGLDVHLVAVALFVKLRLESDRITGVANVLRHGRRTALSVSTATVPPVRPRCLFPPASRPASQPTSKQAGRQAGRQAGQPGWRSGFLDGFRTIVGSSLNSLDPESYLYVCSTIASATEVGPAP
jgi:hypothetical protein